MAEAASEELLGDDGGAPQRTFSWWRIACAVVLAMLLVVPALLYLELGSHRPVGRDGNRAFAQQGSARRMPAAFDLAQVTVPRDQIFSGGPAKDGIPALSQPQLIAGKVASYLAPQDRIIGVVSGDHARAYPLKILNYHEIVNDSLGPVPVAITYCPLCDSAAVFDRRTVLGEREFGVSGLLYNSNVLMYDRSGKNDSLWSQLKAAGISGPGANQGLKLLPLDLTSWSKWLGRYPDTLVLSTETGHNRNYALSPYGSYFENDRLMFPAQPTSDRLPVKERVLGVWSGNAVRAYPLSAFSRENRVAEGRIDGKRLVVEYLPDAGSLRVAEAEHGVEWMYSLWFAWYAMHPETEVFQ